MCTLLCRPLHCKARHKAPLGLDFGGDRGAGNGDVMLGKVFAACIQLSGVGPKHLELKACFVQV